MDDPEIKRDGQCRLDDIKIINLAVQRLRSNRFQDGIGRSSGPFLKKQNFNFKNDLCDDLSRRDGSDLVVNLFIT